MLEHNNQSEKRVPVVFSLHLRAMTVLLHVLKSFLSIFPLDSPPPAPRTELGILISLSLGFAAFTLLMQLKKTTLTTPLCHMLLKDLYQ